VKRRKEHRRHDRHAKCAKCHRVDCTCLTERDILREPRDHLAVGRIYDALPDLPDDVSE
jgi:hypothetical protein